MTFSPEDFRIQVGRYNERWYQDPLPADAVAMNDAPGRAYPSVSTIKKAAGGDWTATAIKRIGTSILKNPNRWNGMDLGEVKRDLNRINGDDLDAASARGTAVHLFAEALMDGIEPAALPNNPGAHWLPAVRRAFNDLQPTPITQEFVVFHRTLNGHGYAGTADALAVINGQTVLIDWKSRGEDAKHEVYAQEAAQVAAYARAEYMVQGVAGGEVARLAIPHIDYGMIVTIKPDDTFAAFPIDLDLSWRWFCGLHSFWCSRLMERDGIGEKLGGRRTRRTSEQIAEDEAAKRERMGDLPPVVAPHVSIMEPCRPSTGATVPGQVLSILTPIVNLEVTETEAFSGLVVTHPSMITPERAAEIKTDFVCATGPKPLLERVVIAGSARDRLIRRIRLILDSGGGETLTYEWPTGVPGLAVEHSHTQAEIALIDRACDRVEAKFSIPFTMDNVPETEAVAASFIRGAGFGQVGHANAEEKAIADMIELGKGLPPDPYPDVIIVELADYEGDPCDPDDMAALIRMLQTLPNDRLEILTKYAADAGNLNLGTQTQRRYDTCMALWFLMSADIRGLNGDAFPFQTEVLTACLDRVQRGAWSETNGQRLGQLTPIEAHTLSVIASDYGTDRLLFAWDEKADRLQIAVPF